jgi:dienelactone hydrolase
MTIRHFIVLAVAGFLAACQTDSQRVQYPTVSLPGLSAPADIRASIYKPEGVGPYPAVVILHGCGGAGDHETGWAKTLNSWGYVALVVDSFGSRGHGNICTNTSLVQPKDRISDIMGAADYLNRQPYVAKERLGLIGFSHGGWTVMKAVQESMQLKDYGFRAAVGYYPYCDPAQDGRVDLSVLILMGAEDNWTPPDRCKRLQASSTLRRPELITAIYYPGTYHSFDRPGPIRQIPGTGEGGTNAPRFIGYNAASAADASQQTRAFFDKHLKAAK